MPVHLEPSREGTTGRRYTGARSGTPSAHFWRNLASFSGSVTGGSSPLVAGSLCKTDSVRSERRKLGTWCGAGSSELVPPLPSSAASSPTALSIPGLDLAGTRPLHPRPRSRRRHPPIPLLEPARLERNTPRHASREVADAQIGPLELLESDASAAPSHPLPPTRSRPVGGGER